MNSDEITSLVTKAVIAAFGMWGGSAFATGAQVQTIAAGAGTLAAVLFGMYRAWNMRKVPEKAVVTSLAPTVADAKAASASVVAAASK